MNTGQVILLVVGIIGFLGLMFAVMMWQQNVADRKKAEREFELAKIKEEDSGGIGNLLKLLTFI